MRFFAHKRRFTTRTKQSGSFARESRPTSHTPPDRQRVQIGAKTQQTHTCLRICRTHSCSVSVGRCVCERTCRHFRNQRLNTGASSSDDERNQTLISLRQHICKLTFCLNNQSVEISTSCCCTLQGLLCREDIWRSPNYI